MKTLISFGMVILTVMVIKSVFLKDSGIVHPTRPPKYGKMWMVVLSEPDKDGTLKLGSVCDEGTFRLDSALPEGIKLHSVVVVELNGQDSRGLPFVSIQGAK